MSTPTLDALFAKFQYLLKDPEFIEQRESFETYFRLVASGQGRPLLTLNNAVLAAQCVIVILEHVKKMEGEGL